MESDWEERIRAMRDEKDDFFGSSRRSPIPADERDDFDGLNYFEPDPDYRYELKLDEFDDKSVVEIGTTEEGERKYLDWGVFSFTVDGEDCELHAYKSDPDESRLWVPFRDETNGDETYGAGRYLDLDEDSHRLDDDRWILDFNQAYNPFCVYSDDYECALIPTTNWLDVSIEAGEKSYK
ncbi:DUF1684 domain-containing protein [Halorutilales archaeon Cl-col2-1]